ncbi:RING_finger domain-containing protein [Hexamita inflata]|uniref:RING finger domain-containing protein n=1 Tax=Hexamita inflata TaxID=28002 RepID=A0AA86QC02_9EUKA|nr:RING finger domain-containing protein [Hexamita inflata]
MQKLGADAQCPYEYTNPTIVYNTDIKQFQQDVQQLKTLQEAGKQKFNEIQNSFLSHLGTAEDEATKFTQYFYATILLNKLLAMSLQQQLPNPENISEKIVNLDIKELVETAKQLQKRLKSIQDELEETSEDNRPQKIKQRFLTNGITIQQGIDFDINIEQMGLEVKKGLYELYRSNWQAREQQAKALKTPLEQICQEKIKELNKLKDEHRNIVKQTQVLKQNQQKDNAKYLEFLTEKVNQLGHKNTEPSSLVIPSAIQSALNVQFELNKESVSIHPQTNLQEKISQIQRLQKIYIEEKSLKQVLLSDELIQLDQKIKSENIQDLIDFSNKYFIEPLNSFESFVTRLQAAIDSQDENAACDLLVDLMSIEAPPTAPTLPLSQIQTNLFAQLVEADFDTNRLNPPYKNAADFSKHVQMLNVDQLLSNITNLQQQINQCAQNLENSLNVINMNKQVHEIKYSPQFSILQQAEFTLTELIKRTENKLREENNKLKEKELEYNQYIKQLEQLSNPELVTNEILLLRKEMFCPLCLSKLISRMLPCGHFYCENCEHKMINQSRRNQKCLVCDKPFQNIIKMLKVGLKPE